MKLISLLAGALALACANLAHAGTVVVPASAVRLCVNIHDQDAPQVVTAMKRGGLHLLPQGRHRRAAGGRPGRRRLQGRLHRH